MTKIVCNAWIEQENRLCKEEFDTTIAWILHYKDRHKET
jgi:hypothetical protein